MSRLSQTCLKINEISKKISQGSCLTRSYVSCMTGLDFKDLCSHLDVCTDCLAKFEKKTHAPAPARAPALDTPVLEPVSRFTPVIPVLESVQIANDSNPLKHNLSILINLDKSLENPDVMLYCDFVEICKYVTLSEQMTRLEKCKSESFKYQARLKQVSNILDKSSASIESLKEPETFDDQLLYASCLSLLEKLQKQVRNEFATYSQNSDSFKVHQTRFHAVASGSDTSKMAAGGGGGGGRSQMAAGGGGRFQMTAGGDGRSQMATDNESLIAAAGDEFLIAAAGGSRSQMAVGDLNKSPTSCAFNGFVQRSLSQNPLHERIEYSRLFKPNQDHTSIPVSDTKVGGSVPNLSNQSQVGSAFEKFIPPPMSSRSPSPCWHNEKMPACFESNGAHRVPVQHHVSLCGKLEASAAFDDLALTHASLEDCESVFEHEEPNQDLAEDMSRLHQSPLDCESDKKLTQILEQDNHILECLSDSTLAQSLAESFSLSRIDSRSNSPTDSIQSTPEPRLEYIKEFYQYATSPHLHSRGLTDIVELLKTLLQGEIEDDERILALLIEKIKKKRNILEKLCQF
jgi:hypothetical protein